MYCRKVRKAMARQVRRLFQLTQVKDHSSLKEDGGSGDKIYIWIWEILERENRYVLLIDWVLLRVMDMSKTCKWHLSRKKNQEAASFMFFCIFVWYRYYEKPTRKSLSWVLDIKFKMFLNVWTGWRYQGRWRTKSEAQMTDVGRQFNLESLVYS